MQQQIRFFESLTRLEIVKYVPIILLLNQTDVLERLITIRPISEYFEDYTGGANCFYACHFFADKFAKSDQRMFGNLRIYGTCAVDQDCFEGTLEGLESRSPRYNGTDRSVSNSVAKPPVDERYEESFSWPDLS